MTVIDAHAHLWQRARTPQSWIDPGSMAVLDRDFWVEDLAGMQAAGIDGAILVQSANSRTETLDLLAVAANPGVLGVIGWVDLEADVAGQLAALNTSSLVGIRHLAHEDPDPAWLLRPGVDYGALADHDLPFDLVVHPRQLLVASATAAANPRTQFVLDHLGNPPISSGNLKQWREGLTEIARNGNVVAKLSGLTLQVDWADWSIEDLREPVETALSLFGPSRLMFGSDWPLVLLASDAPSWLDIVRELVPVEHHAAVLSDNARRIYLGGTHA
jgi:L-fuconolactonase